MGKRVCLATDVDVSSDSVTAGEPLTHFNLDQLLEIVQSFQLDTTHAHGSGRPGDQSDKKVCLAAWPHWPPRWT